MAATRANVESFNVGDTFLTKYQVRGLIGRGGQATVYHSYDTYIDRDVAIKVMADTSDSKREHSRRAQMEARVLCKFHHPNIVHVFDAGTTESGLTYIIMELLRGRTLREVMRHLHKLTVYEALSLGAQIADGVEIAHRQQVIHRDLKPENIFVVDSNTVKVLDFGIAKFLTLTGITTQRDTLQGTMWYISPEHAQGLGVTARSDIYALGSILYEAISGTPPCLMGLQEITTQSVAWSQISRMPPQLDALMPGVPVHVGRLIQRMLVKEPGKRFASMAEVAAMLRTACKRMDSEAGGSATVLRELWHDGQSKPKPPEMASSDLGVADTFKDPRGPNVMQPTVEVRQSVQGAAAEPAGSPASPAVAADRRPVASQALAADRPVASQALAAPELDALADNRGTNAKSFDAGSDGLPSKSSTSRRWQLVAIAVALGTLVGIALGFSKSHSSEAMKDQSPTAQPSVEVTVIPPAQLEPIATSKLATTPAAVASAVSLASSAAPAPPDSITPPLPSAGREPSPRAVTSTIKQGNSLPNKESPASAGKTPHLKTPAPSADRGTTKKLPTAGLRPPYTGEDLE